MRAHFLLIYQGLNFDINGLHLGYSIPGNPDPKKSGFRAFRANRKPGLDGCEMPGFLGSVLKVVKDTIPAHA